MSARRLSPRPPPPPRCPRRAGLARPHPLRPARPTRSSRPACHRRSSRPRTAGRQAVPAEDAIAARTSQVPVARRAAGSADRLWVERQGESGLGTQPHPVTEVIVRVRQLDRAPQGSGSVEHELDALEAWPVDHGLDLNMVVRVSDETQGLGHDAAVDSEAAALVRRPGDLPQLSLLLALASLPEGLPVDRLGHGLELDLDRRNGIASIIDHAARDQEVRTIGPDHSQVPWEPQRRRGRGGSDRSQLTLPLELDPDHELVPGLAQVAAQVAQVVDQAPGAIGDGLAASLDRAAMVVGHGQHHGAGGVRDGLPVVSLEHDRQVGPLTSIDAHQQLALEPVRDELEGAPGLGLHARPERRRDRGPQGDLAYRDRSPGIGDTRGGLRSVGSLGRMGPRELDRNPATNEGATGHFLDADVHKTQPNAVLLLRTCRGGWWLRCRDLGVFQS